MKFFSAVCVVLLSFAAMAFAGMPASNHVVLVVEENHSYSSVIGNSAMPYLNNLAAKYGLATQYYANTHPSIGNYFMLTTGQIVTNDDSFTGVINVDDVVDHLQTAGKTWKSYAESLPYAGYTGGDAYPYVKRHNPFSYFSEVVNSSEKNNLVPFTQFAKDLTNNQLPNFSFIVPNVVDDAHDGTLQQADTWLSQNIAPLFKNPTFQKDGVLIIVFDESTTSDTQGGGGHVAALVIGPQVKSGYQSGSTYQHQSTLKSLLAALGVTSFPGAAQTAPDMGGFFGQNQSANPVVTSPLNNSVDPSPVHFVATASNPNCSKGISAIGVYTAPGVLAYWNYGANLNTNLNLAPGTYNTVVQDWDNCGGAGKTPVTITVTSGSSGSVSVSSPGNNSTVNSPVHFVATSTTSCAKGMSAIGIYTAPGQLAYWVGGANLNHYLSMAPGTYNTTVQAWDNCKNAFKAFVKITVN